MATETISLVLDETWALVSNAAAGSFGGFVVSGPVIWYLGSSAPAAGRNYGITDKRLVYTSLDTKVYARAVSGVALVNVSRTVDAANVAESTAMPNGGGSISVTTFRNDVAVGSTVATITPSVTGAKATAIYPTNSGLRIGSNGLDLIKTETQIPTGALNLTIIMDGAKSLNSPTSFNVSFDVTAPAGGGGVTPQRRALALNDEIVFLGCSLENETNWTGYTGRLMSFMNHRLQFNPYSNFGWPGSRPDQFTDQADLALGMKPAVLWLGELVNATISGSALTVASQTDPLEAIMQAFGAQSQAKLIVLERTRTVQQAKDNNKIALLDGMNAWAKAQHLRQIGNAYVWYIDAPYDISTAGADNAQQRDGVHDKAPADVISRRRFELFKELLPVGRTLPVLGQVPAGALNANPLFDGSAALSGGGAGFSGASGVGSDNNYLNVTMTGLTIVASKINGNRGQRFRITGTAGASGDVYLNLPGINSVRGKKYVGKLHYQISAGDGVSPASALGQFGIGATDIPTVGGTGHGPISAAFGDNILLARDDKNQINIDTGLPYDRGEPWLVTRVQQAGESRSQGYRLYFTPRAGTTVDILIDFDFWSVEEFVEPSMKPVYIAGKRTRTGDGNPTRFAQGYAAIHTASGNQYASINNGNLRIAATALTGTWKMSQGDWKAGAGTTYDQMCEIQKSGSTDWTVVYSTAPTNWQFTGGSALAAAAGDTLRFTTTATNALGTTTAVETMAVI